MKPSRVEKSCWHANCYIGSERRFIMGVFSRFLDIVNSNINALLDQAEDPEKMIKLMINEMEDTIIEIKTSCASVIGSKNTTDRKIKELEALISRWQSRAELAISNGKDALAKEALLEKKKLTETLIQLKDDAQKYESAIEKYKADIAQLEEKLASAKEKYKKMREESQKTQEQNAKTSFSYNFSSFSDKGSSDSFDKEDPMERFARMEERIDRMKARKEQEQQQAKKDEDLEQKFKDLEELNAIQKELDELKKKMENN